jgi:very-short-patch-repair endonuclease
MVERGYWAPTAPGVYRSTAVAQSYLQQVLAACLSIRDPVAASHLTAASMWRLSGADPPTVPATLVHVSTPEERRIRGRPGVRVHRTRHYDSHDLTTLDGVPVTTLARTLVDMASHLNRAALAVVIDDALCRRLVKLVDLRRTAARVGVPGTRGAGVLKEELRWWEDHPELDSVAEAAMLRMLTSRSIPPPVPQFVVRHRGQAIARVDFAWPEQRVALEVDGFRFHTRPAAFGADRARQNRLIDAGWIVLRTTPFEMKAGGHELVETLVRVVERRAAGYG